MSPIVYLSSLAPQIIITITSKTHSEILTEAFKLWYLIDLGTRIAKLKSIRGIMWTIIVRLLGVKVEQNCLPFTLLQEEIRKNLQANLVVTELLRSLAQISN